MKVDLSLVWWALCHRFSAFCFSHSCSQWISSSALLLTCFHAQLGNHSVVFSSCEGVSFQLDLHALYSSDRLICPFVAPTFLLVLFFADKPPPAFFPAWRIIFCLYVWIQQRVQPSWTQTGTLAPRQTASLSWPFTPTPTAVAAEVEVWEMVTPTARGAQGVSRIRTPTDR